MIACALLAATLIATTVLAQPTTRVFGKVCHASGEPWPHAGVWLTTRPIADNPDAGTQHVVRVQADARGRFEANVPGRDPCTVWALQDADGGVRASDVVVAVGQPVTLTEREALLPRRLVRVLGCEAWRAYGPLRLRLVDHTFHRHVTWLSLDDGGQARLPPVVGMQARLELFARYAECDIPLLSQRVDPSERAALDVALPAPDRRVCWAADRAGEPRAHAAVHWALHACPVGGIANREPRPVVDLRDYVPLRLTLRTHKGEPAAGSRIRVRPSVGWAHVDAIADRRGQATVLVPRGGVSARAIHDGSVLVRLLEVRGGAPAIDPADVALTFESPRWVRGRLVDKDGRPCVGALVGTSAVDPVTFDYPTTDWSSATGNGARVVRPVGDGEVRHLAHVAMGDAVTGADGEFALPMPPFAISVGFYSQRDPDEFHSGRLLGQRTAWDGKRADDVTVRALF